MLQLALIFFGFHIFCFKNYNYIYIGKSIWSLAVDQNKQVISTGGGDGSVRLWSLGDDKENMQRQQHSFSTMPQKDTTFQPDMEIPRSLAFLPNNNVLVMTNNG